MYDVFSIAQAEQRLPTAFETISVLMIMLVMAGSLLMLIVWGVRISAGHQPLPIARRRPLHVPPVLTLVCGALCGLMALLVLVASFMPNLENGTATNQANIEDSDDQVDENVTEALDTNLPAEPESVIADSPNENSSTETATSKELPSTEDQSAEGIAQGNKAPAKNVQQTIRATRSALWQNLVFTFAEFVLFGVAVWVVQKGYSRNLSRAEASPAVVRDHSRSPATVIDPFPDLDADPEFANHTSKWDPFQAHDTQLLDSSKQPVPEVSEAAESKSAEPWKPAVEIKYAFQAFLAAYLPTALLRLLMVFLIQDTKSHPFLQMLENSPPIDVLLFIFVSAVFIAPIVEELMFRVILMGGIQQQGYRKTGLVIAAVLFCMAHGFPDSIALIPLAVVLGYTYQQRRSYRTVVLIHFFFNGFNMLVAGIGLLG